MMLPHHVSLWGWCVQDGMKCSFSAIQCILFTGRKAWLWSHRTKGRGSFTWLVCPPQYDLPTFHSLHSGVRVGFMNQLTNKNATYCWDWPHSATCPRAISMFKLVETTGRYSFLKNTIALIITRFLWTKVFLPFVFPCWPDLCVFYPSRNYFTWAERISAVPPELPQSLVWLMLLLLYLLPLADRHVLIN